MKESQASREMICFIACLSRARAARLIKPLVSISMVIFLLSHAAPSRANSGALWGGGDLSNLGAAPTTPFFLNCGLGRAHHFHRNGPYRSVCSGSILDPRQPLGISDVDQVG